MSIYDVEPNELIEKTAQELKKIKEIKPEKWAAYVKTGVHKERPPQREDWWYIRAASILRKLVRYQPIGVAKLRRKYGGRKRKGVKPEHFYKGSGNIIRKVLQQLEKAELVKIVKDKRKGRALTKKGKELLNNIAFQISGIKHEKVKIKKQFKKTVEIKKPTKEKPKKKKEKIKELKKEIKGEKKEDKVKKMVEKTKDFAKGKKTTAEDILKES